MDADPIGPGHAGRMDGDEPGHCRVVTLPVKDPAVAPGRGIPGLRRGASATILRFGLHFTAADHAALAAWASGTGHGYDRLRVERGLLEDGGWTTYALVYAPGQAWSTWGMTRRDGHVEVWRCADWQTVGHHARMVDALASLPHATDRRRAPHMDAGQAGTRRGSHRHGTR